VDTATFEIVIRGRLTGPVATLLDGFRVVRVEGDPTVSHHRAEYVEFGAR
jgi:hypothetical protein